MSVNVGTIDRIIRIIIGLILLALAFGLVKPVLAGVWVWVAGIIGAVLVLTAITGICPAYSILGIRTRSS